MSAACEGRVPGAERTQPADLDYSLPSRLEAIADLAVAVEGVLADDPQLAFQVNLCLDELLTNTITHGLGGSPDHVVRVVLRRAAGWLQIVLEDDAPPFDPFAEAVEPDLGAGVDERPIGGLGVHFVRELMDEYGVDHAGGGNRVVLRKQLAAGDAST